MKNRLSAATYFLISFAFHGILLLMFNFFADSGVIHKKFLVLGAHSKKPSHALYKPMNKPIPFVGGRRPQRKTPCHPSKKKQPQKKKAQAKLQNKKKQAPKKIKKPQKKVAAKKNAKNLKKKNHTTQKKNTKQTSFNKKDTQKKKIINPQKKTPKKQVQQIEQKPQEKKKVVQKAQEVLEDEIDFEDDLVFSLLETNDPKIRAMQKQIQAEVLRCWQPPVGVPKNTECCVQFVIDKKGIVSQFEFLTRSNILIYDLSISRVAKKFKFAKVLWGKTFVIDFRQ